MRKDERLRVNLDPAAWEILTEYSSTNGLTLTQAINKLIHRCDEFTDSFWRNLYYDKIGETGCPHCYHSSGKVDFCICNQMPVRQGDINEERKERNKDSFSRV